MGKRFDKGMKKLIEKFEKIFGRTMKPSEHGESKPDEKFKTFERSGPGFHMKIGVFNLTGQGQFEWDNLPKSSEEKEGEVDEMEEARKLALKRFEEKKEKTEK